MIVLTAAVVGVLDAALVRFGIAGAQGAFQFVPARIWLVSPVTWVMLAMLAAGAACLVTRRWAGVCAVGAVVIAFVGIRLRAHPGLLVVSIAALGLLSALMFPWINSWLSQPRRSVAAGALAILGSGVALAAGDPVTSSSAAAAPSAVNGPNVILVVLDTVRYDAVFDDKGDVHRELGALARLRRDSTVFTRAYATSPWTLPSHLSAVTGLDAHELGVSFDVQAYERPEQTLAERFRSRGYRTAAVISNSFLNAGSGFTRGYDTFQQAQAALDLCRTAPGLMAERYWPWFAAAVCNWTAREVTGRALRLMTDEDRPFFLTLNYMDAHDPYYVERSCGAGAGYRAAVRCLDRHLGPVIDWGSPRRPTVLALLSDHGEQFGEHGLARHGNSLYVQLLHVPMMLRSVDESAPRTSAAPLSIAALPALLGVTGGAAQPDRPVLALLHPPAAESLPSHWSALDAAWHLIVTADGTEALYHLAADPSETHNLISAPPEDAAIAGLRASVDRMRRLPKPDLRKFRSLGYVH